MAHLKQNNADGFLLCVLQYYPLEEVLAAEYLLEDFRPDLIEMVLDKLRPEHVRSVHDAIPALAVTSTTELTLMFG